MVLDPRVALFQEFKKDYGRTYTGEEEVRRFANFKAALEKIEELNKINVAGGGDECFGITETADRDDDEKSHMRGRANHYDDRFEVLTWFHRYRVCHATYALASRYTHHADHPLPSTSGLAGARAD